MVVDTIFAVANCALLSAVIFFVFKNSIVPMLAQEVTDHLRRRSLWKSDAQNLEEYLDVLQKKESTQAEHYDTLTEKAILWQRSVAERQKVQEQNSCVLRGISTVRRAQQRAERQRQVLMGRVMPHALDAARRELHEYYHREQHRGARYIDRVIAMTTGVKHD